jgi:transformation/transcription domain-associated protein
MDHPLPFRENIVSFLVRRLATSSLEPTSRTILLPRAMLLLQKMVTPSGWSDVIVELNFFSHALEQVYVLHTSHLWNANATIQTELDSEPHLNQALSAAKVLQVVAADKDDAWYLANATILQSLVRKDLTTDDHGLHDALHPIFEHLLQLFPLPDTRFLFFLCSIC